MGDLCDTIPYWRYSLACLFHDPAAAHRLVKVHQGLEENSLCLRPCELRVEKAPFRIEHLDVARVAVFKSQTCEAGVGQAGIRPARLYIKLFP